MATAINLGRYWDYLCGTGLGQTRKTPFAALAGTSYFRQQNQVLDTLRSRRTNCGSSTSGTTGLTTPWRESLQWAHS